MSVPKSYTKYLHSRFLLQLRPILPRRFVDRVQRRMEKHKPANPESHWKYMESRFILRFRPLLPKRFAARMQRRMEKHLPWVATTIVVSTVQSPTVRSEFLSAEPPELVAESQSVIDLYRRSREERERMQTNKRSNLS